MNCCWATAKEQNNHKRNNRLVEYDGETLSLSAWAERKGMKPGTLGMRLDAGWPVGRALNDPVAIKRRKPAVPA